MAEAARGSREVVRDGNLERDSGAARVFVRASPGDDGGAIVARGDILFFCSAEFFEGRSARCGGCFFATVPAGVVRENFFGAVALSVGPECAGFAAGCGDLAGDGWSRVVYADGLGAGADGLSGGGPGGDDFAGDDGCAARQRRGHRQAGSGSELDRGNRGVFGQRGVPPGASRGGGEIFGRLRWESGREAGRGLSAVSGESGGAGPAFSFFPDRRRGGQAAASCDGGRALLGKHKLPAPARSGELSRDAHRCGCGFFGAKARGG